jgi:hypothetical protein
MDDQVEALPLAEAAQFLRVSWPRAWRLMLMGRLDGRKVGGRWFITTASIEAFLAREARHATPRQ